MVRTFDSSVCQIFARRHPDRDRRGRWQAAAVVLGAAHLLAPVARADADSLEASLLAEPRAALAAAAQRDGDPQRGAAIFYARGLACATCHSVGDRPNSLGPDLTRLPAEISDALLVEALLDPSRTIAAGYANLAIETVDGQLISGLPVEETDERVVLRDAAQPDQFVAIDAAEIAERHEVRTSLMPAGQMNQLRDRQQFLDLVRFLIDLRDGGVERARQLQPPPDPLAEKTPDEPLPWKPVVQRGEVAVDDALKYPHAVAMGFVGGSVLFDANQLRLAAVWREGFVKHAPQSYFGLFWHRDGGAPDLLDPGPRPFAFQFARHADWTPCEEPPRSDPNEGSRFDGYQIGQSSVQLRYRLRAGDVRVAVAETVRAENRSPWQGFVREVRVQGLPAGTRMAVAVAADSAAVPHAADGAPLADPVAAAAAPLLVQSGDDGVRVVRVAAAHGFAWLPDDSASGGQRRVVLEAHEADEPLTVRIDAWKHAGSRTAPTPSELAALDRDAPVLDDAFGRPVVAARASAATAAANHATPVVRRPAINARENFDEFPPVHARFLRLRVLRTSDGNPPALDELEVYGLQDDVNLAPQAVATASSTLDNEDRHAPRFLNDGLLGEHSTWIGGEEPPCWAQLEFPQEVELRRVAWGRDRSGAAADRIPQSYWIEISRDGRNWIKVADEGGRIAEPPPPIRRDASPGYAMEALPLPFPACRPSDIAFSQDGKTLFAIAMTEGQVWRTPVPPVGQPDRVQWRRYATGLYHPIGLAVVGERLFVAQKPEITELIDRDGDGSVETYRTLATGWGLSTGWHEYCFGLAVDARDNLWFALNTGYFWTNPGFVNPGRWRGSILRVDPASERLEEMAKGCRVPNGIAPGPDGQIFFTDNQGDWIQSCKLAHVVPGRFYGHPETAADALPEGKFPNGVSAVWLPHEQSRSASGPVYDGSAGRFGPFDGQMFLGDAGYGANPGIMRLTLEKVGGEYQGACIRFMEGQPLGCERMKFGPDDQLYMASLTSGLTRVAFSGSAPLAIRTVRVRPGGQGFVIELTKPLAPGRELTVDDVEARRFHYLYTGAYGSPRADEQAVPVAALTLSEDRTKIAVTLPVETHPLGMVYELTLAALESDEGDALAHRTAWYTVHRLPE